jgi:hypothetical protein
VTVAALTPAQRIYEAAAAAGVLGDGSDPEARTDHAAVDAEVRARLEAGLRVDDSIRAQLRAKYTSSPSMSLNFERMAYNAATGEYVPRTDQNALADFTAHLRAHQVAEQQQHALYIPDGRGGMKPGNALAEQVEAESWAQYWRVKAEMDRMNAHLPPGYPR